MIQCNLVTLKSVELVPTRNSSTHIYVVKLVYRQAYYGLSNCTDNTAEICFSFWRFVGSGASYDFSILHSYFHCFVVFQDYHSIKAINLQENSPVFHRHTANRELC